MPAPGFPAFFSAAFEDKRHPYDYQKRLACGERNGGQDESDRLSQSGPCESLLITIPTGLGKTAAVVLAWLWNRVGTPSLNPQLPLAPPPRLSPAHAHAGGGLRLLEHYGPFRLACFEALFRAADIRASILAAAKP